MSTIVVMGPSIIRVASSPACESHNAATGAPAWHKPDDGQSGLATIGRGLLAGHKVYWPTSLGLIVLDQETGDLIASDKRIQGNLAATDGCLVATGKTKMTVYLPEE